MNFLRNLPNITRLTLSLVILGALFKLLHWPNGTLMMNIGLIASFVSLLYHYVKNTNNYIWLLYLALISYYFIRINHLFSL